MRENIFTRNEKKYGLADYMNFDVDVRESLGNEVSIEAYRLLEFSLREELIEQFGKEVQTSVFRNAGYRAGAYLTKSRMDLTLSFDRFISQLQTRMNDMKIGILNLDSVDEETGKIVLTVEEDADCSGLPMLEEPVCNYEEGFISGILSTYTGKKYDVSEVACWAAGDRICRFNADIK